MEWFKTWGATLVFLFLHLFFSCASKRHDNSILCKQVQHNYIYDTTKNNKEESHLTSVKFLCLNYVGKKFMLLLILDFVRIRPSACRIFINIFNTWDNARENILCYGHPDTRTSLGEQRCCRRDTQTTTIFRGKLKWYPKTSNSFCKLQTVSQTSKSFSET